MTRLFAGTPWDRLPVCERCQLAETECKCSPLAPILISPEKQRLNVFTEKRQKGKYVTVVKGLINQGDKLQEVLTILKTFCGAGGTIKDELLEIQGEHKDKIQQKLIALGYKMK